MTGRLLGKTAFVTAAGAGIGLATVQSFLREGAHVIATDIHTANLEKLEGLGELTIETLDVLNAEEISAAGLRHANIDILFSNAGFVHNGSLLNSEEKDFDFAFNMNVKSMYRVIKIFLPSMIKNGGGSIIMTSSIASTLKGILNRCVYSASKAAVAGLMKSIAADYVQDGIRCNAIAPGTIDTPSLNKRINQATDPAAQKKAFVNRQPMLRLGSAEEVANLVLFLASEESSFCTGQIYLVDGGVVM